MIAEVRAIHAAASAVVEARNTLTDALRVNRQTQEDKAELLRQLRSRGADGRPLKRILSTGALGQSVGYAYCPRVYFPAGIRTIFPMAVEGGAAGDAGGACPAAATGAS